MKLIKRIVKKIVRSLPMKYIIFESAPDLSDNTKAVFDEMIRRGIHKKYRFVWLVSDRNKINESYPNTVFVDYENDSLRFLYYNLRAKCLIFCNSFIKKANENTLSFYLTHATQIKDSSSYYHAPQDIDYCFVTAKAFEGLMAKVYGVSEYKIVSLGFPRNDILFTSKFDAKKLWNNRYNKIVVWYPTFRQSKGGRVVEGCDSLPIIHDENSAKIINQYLVEKNILIVLKPHFAQDISYLKKLQLSNIEFIDESYFERNNLTSYEFISGCDALLTDYSSIYFDYLACNKPIGVVWEDIENYKKNRGFCMDINYYLKGAEKIYNLGDFLHFLEHLSNNVDVLAEERWEICSLAHDFTDGKNTDRVVDYIIKYGL